MMIYKSVSWISFHVFVFFQCFTLAPCEVKYELEFADSIMNCPDFNNDKIKADTIKLGLIEGEDGEDSFGLNGVLEVCVPLDDEYDLPDPVSPVRPGGRNQHHPLGPIVVIDVCKETEVACDPVMQADMNLCKSMKEENVPWDPVFKKMNVSECPIIEGSYEITNLILSMEPFKGCLSRDFCGYYSVKLKIVNKLETLSCHMAYIEIVEKQV
ncbi:hypothetical protein ABMA28_002270 [Loxostege sticticalis]|uniref:Uncharacterized protein n=1 Tax=Loxostege sticticalis TaxID=481309 RepID=A0ABD0T0J7_LOXSC